MTRTMVNTADYTARHTGILRNLYSSAGVETGTIINMREPRIT